MWLPLVWIVSCLTITAVVDCQLPPRCRSDSLRELTLVVSLPFHHPVPIFDPSWDEGDRVMPSLYLAKDQINNSTQLLPCHRLELVRVDGGCDISATTAISTALSLYDAQGKTREVIGMVGPGCSASSVHTSHVLNQPQIQLVNVHGGGSPLLGDRNKYENSLGILGSSLSFVELAISLMKLNNWHNIAILFESNRIYYRTTKEALMKALDVEQEYGVNVTFESPIYSHFYPLDGVRSSLSRIIFLFTSLYHVKRVLCLAYHAEMFYPAYQWVIIGHQLEEIQGNSPLMDNVTYNFTYADERYECPISAIINVAMEATFLTNYQLQSYSGRPTIANITFDMFQKLYEERAAIANVTTSYWASYFYDAIWAWARVLDRMTTNSSGAFDNIQFQNKTLARMIIEQFYANDFEFEGMSGLISFNSSDGFYDRPFNLYQVMGGEQIHVAYNNETALILSEGVKLKVISDIVRSPSLLSHSLIVIFALILFLLFFVTAMLHILTVVYRKSKSVKASSPKLSHFAFLGVYFVIFALLLFLFLRVTVLPHHISGPLCQASWVWFLSIGFTLSIGTVIVRTWRLYRIFYHYLDPGNLISNPALITILAMLVSVDLVIAVVWTAIDSREIVVVRDTIQNGLASELVVIRQCRSRYDRVWIAITYAYKLGLVVVLVTLTLLTRKIVNKNFTTTTLKVFSYIFTVIFVTGFGLYYFFTYAASATYRLNPDISYGILYGTVSAIIVIYLLCVLLPPLLPVLRAKIKRPSWRLSIPRKHSVDNKDLPDERRLRKTSADALL